MSENREQQGENVAEQVRDREEDQDEQLELDDREKQERRDDATEAGRNTA